MFISFLNSLFHFHFINSYLFGLAHLVLVILVLQGKLNEN